MQTDGQMDSWTDGGEGRHLTLRAIGNWAAEAAATSAPILRFRNTQQKFSQVFVAKQLKLLFCCPKMLHDGNVDGADKF